MTNTYFKNIENINELKKAYHKLCKLNHPDNGGDTATMAQINNEYEYMFNKLKNAQNTDKSTTHINETPEQFKDIINKIINLDLDIELCGSWVWVSGNTKPFKDVLKAAGFRWASKKHMWYWRAEENAVYSKGKSKTMAEIRNKYGSDTITKARAQLTA